MITTKELKDVLIYLGYTEKNKNIYAYYFTDFNCEINVDFNNNKIIYPSQIKVNEKQTCNFSSNENFVVLECIHRLISKGYNPAHIELERRWSLGHTQKSGKADICINDIDNKNTLMIIECKTYGSEYRKEKKNIQNDGGQLFSYRQQDRSVKWISLYSSDFINNKIVIDNETICTFDDNNIASLGNNNKSIKLYMNSNTKEDLHNVWKETYGSKMYENIIFGENSTPYKVGVAPLRKKDLKDFSIDNRIVSQFEEILRHNNISDKENAFNRLIALFICKLVDEITKNDDDEVEFQYKQGTDTYETIQDRLQRLHKEGMEKFMKEEILYVSTDYPEFLFKEFVGQQRKNAINDLKEKFKILKFYSNNDFAFKDVHNKELFLQNGKVLVEMVQLFEKYRIVYNAQHQFLGDLFEQLLNKGFKQNEGQFFTPRPITRFIWESLPIEHILETQGYPKIIDYACGAGHFLTEAVEIINNINKTKNNDWVENTIYGIEKDYRLARVSKISLFMNGAGKGNIIFGDGLDNSKEKGIKNNSFDILIANPPYSVKGFKNHLDLKDNDFSLLKYISNDGKEIEVLFVERIYQLLKPNGIASIILPTSILNKPINSYIECRKILFKYFDIKSIVQLRGKTFGETDTTTVILFLEKYHESPKRHALIEDSIEAIFSNNRLETWGDKDIFDNYVQHINVNANTYIDFICESIFYLEYEQNEYFKIYLDDFKNSTLYKKISDNKKLTNIYEKMEKLNKSFYTYVKNIEREKMFYFAMVRNKKILVIDMPESTAEQKEFLGYEWSKRKGSEGINIVNLGGMLFDPCNKNSEIHIARYIREIYSKNTDDIYDISSISKYAKILNKENIIDFTKSNFDLNVNLIPKFEVEISTKYKKYKISNIFDSIESGNRPKGGVGNLKEGILSLGGEHIDNNTGYLKLDSPKYVTQEFYESQSRGHVKKGDLLICKDGARTGKIALIRDELNNKKAMINEHVFLLRKSDDENLTKFIYYILITTIGQSLIKSKITGSSQGGLNKSNLNNIEIPLPPKSIRDILVKECEKIEIEFNNTRMTVENYKNKIQFEFNKLGIIK